MDLAVKPGFLDLSGAYSNFATSTQSVPDGALYAPMVFAGFPAEVAAEVAAEAESLPRAQEADVARKDLVAA